MLHYLAGITQSQSVSPKTGDAKLAPFPFLYRIDRLIDEREDRYKAYLDFIKVIESFFKLVKRLWDWK